MKTVERAHTPRYLWERVKLSRNYLQALEQINKHLMYWPTNNINRCKQRLTKIRQMLVQMRRMAMREMPAPIPIKHKTEKREKRREIKAETAAKVDVAIEKELLERLKLGTYGDIYNFPRKQFDEQLGAADPDLETEVRHEFVEDLEDDDEEWEDSADEQIDQIEFEDEGNIPDLEDVEAYLDANSRKRLKTFHGPHVEVEYEDEMDMDKT